MALNIKDPEAERLAVEVAELTGESKTGAVREALRERRERLRLQRGVTGTRRSGLRRFLETEVWPQIPPSELGRPTSHAEREQALGYGAEGV